MTAIYLGICYKRETNISGKIEGFCACSSCMYGTHSVQKIHFKRLLGPLEAALVPRADTDWLWPTVHLYRPSVADWGVYTRPILIRNSISNGSWGFKRLLELLEAALGPKNWGDTDWGVTLSQLYGTHSPQKIHFKRLLGPLEAALEFLEAALGAKIGVTPIGG